MHCTVLYCTALYCTVLYCTVLCCAVLYCAVLCCAVLCCTVLFCSALHCIALHCIALYCTVLYCAVLYCIVLYCLELFHLALLSPVQVWLGRKSKTVIINSNPGSLTQFIMLRTTNTDHYPKICNVKKWTRFLCNLLKHWYTINLEPTDGLPHILHSWLAILLAV